MESKINTTTREDWLNKAALLIRAELIDTRTALSTDRPIRISLSPMASKNLGACYPSSRSPVDHANEITITMHSNDSVLILSTLAHGLIHAYDDCVNKHGPVFRAAAIAIGLEGKMTATTAGAELTATLSEYVELLGEIPHFALTHIPKDKGRNGNKLVCHDCDFKANTSAKWAQQINPYFVCPVCQSQNTSIITK